MKSSASLAADSNSTRRYSLPVAPMGWKVPQPKGSVRPAAATPELVTHCPQPPGHVQRTGHQSLGGGASSARQGAPRRIGWPGRGRRCTQGQGDVLVYVWTANLKNISPPPSNQSCSPKPTKKSAIQPPLKKNYPKKLKMELCYTSPLVVDRANESPTGEGGCQKLPK